MASVLSPHCSGRIKHGRRPGDEVLIPPTNNVPLSLIGSAFIYQIELCASGILGRVVHIGTKDTTSPTSKNYNSQKTLSMDDGLCYTATYVGSFVVLSLLRDRIYEYFHKLSTCQVSQRPHGMLTMLVMLIKDARRAVTAEKKKQNKIRCLTCSSVSAGEFQSERPEEHGALCPARRCSIFTSASVSPHPHPESASAPRIPRALRMRTSRLDCCVATRREEGSRVEESTHFIC